MMRRSRIVIRVVVRLVSFVRREEQSSSEFICSCVEFLMLTAPLVSRATSASLSRWLKC